MGEDIETGVVDHRRQVFGYPNLYVADGAILARPTGRNPSMTIGALAERVADLMVSGQAG
nr:GMC oxidoreductase [Thiocystis violacea]